MPDHSKQDGLEHLKALRICEIELFTCSTTKSAHKHTQTRSDRCKQPAGCVWHVQKKKKDPHLRLTHGKDKFIHSLLSLCLVLGLAHHHHEVVTETSKRDDGLIGVCDLQVLKDTEHKRETEWGRRVSHHSSTPYQTTLHTPTHENVRPGPFTLMSDLAMFDKRKVWWLIYYLDCKWRDSFY